MQIASVPLFENRGISLLNRLEALFVANASLTKAGDWKKKPPRSTFTNLVGVFLPGQVPIGLFHLA